MSLANNNTTPKKADNSEVLDLFGPSIQFLIPHCRIVTLIIA